MVVLGPIIVLLLGTARDALTLWLGAEYAAQSALAMQILAIGVLINALAHVPYALLHSIRRPDLPARFHLIELPIQIVLAWVLISRFGITGAAVAWTLRMLIDAALLFVAAHRTHALRPHSLREQLMPFAVFAVGAAGAGAIVVSSNVHSPLTRMIVALVLAIACAVILWLVAVPSTQRQRITGLFRSAA
jgi:O-antigen/teichoic acid export membrane protein